MTVVLPGVWPKRWRVELGVQSSWPLWWVGCVPGFSSKIHSKKMLKRSTLNVQESFPNQSRLSSQAASSKHGRCLLLSIPSFVRHMCNNWPRTLYTVFVFFSSRRAFMFSSSPHVSPSLSLSFPFLRPSLTSQVFSLIRLIRPLSLSLSRSSFIVFAALLEGACPNNSFVTNSRAFFSFLFSVHSFLVVNLFYRKSHVQA